MEALSVHLDMNVGFPLKHLVLVSFWEKVDASILEHKILQLRSRSAHVQARTHKFDRLLDYV